MKILSFCLRDLIDDKLDTILEWAISNNVSDIYILSSGVEKNSLSKVVTKLPENIKISFFLDSASSYDLSVNDLKVILKGKDNVTFISDVLEKINCNNTIINLVNDFVEQDDLSESVDFTSPNYNIFVLRENKYKFSFKVFSNSKSVFVSMPFLNDNGDMLLIDKRNNIVCGEHLSLKDSIVVSSVLFKI